MSQQKSNKTIKALIAGNVSLQKFTEYDGTRLEGGTYIEAGGRIVLGDGVTSVGVAVTDALGRSLYNATVTANTDIPPIPESVLLPLFVTTTSIAGGTVVTVYWGVRK